MQSIKILWALGFFPYISETRSNLKRRISDSDSSSKNTQCNRKNGSFFLPIAIGLPLNLNPFPPSVPIWHRLVELSILI